MPIVSSVMTPILHSLSISDVFYFLMIFIFLFWTHRVPTLQWLFPPSPSSPSSVTKGRHHLKKNVFFRALPESPNPPKCIFQSAFFQSVEVLHFSKCTRLTHLLSFVNLFERCCWSLLQKRPSFLLTPLSILSLFRHQIIYMRRFSQEMLWLLASSCAPPSPGSINPCIPSSQGLLGGLCISYWDNPPR